MADDRKPLTPDERRCRNNLGRALVDGDALGLLRACEAERDAVKAILRRALDDSSVEIVYMGGIDSHRCACGLTLCDDVDECLYPHVPGSCGSSAGDCWVVSAVEAGLLEGE